jgi:S1-C subfamily serine protease
MPAFKNRRMVPFCRETIRKYCTRRNEGKELLTVFCLLFFTFCQKDNPTGVNPPKNSPPTKPVLSYPANAVTGIPISDSLKWSATDPDKDILIFNIFLDSINPPRYQIASDITSKSFAFSGLANNKMYYWQIIASDGKDSTKSDVYRFSTTVVAPNHVPTIELANYPQPSSTNNELQPMFSWSASDPDNDSLTIEILLDTISTPAKVYIVENGNTFTPDSLEFNKTYYWFFRISDKDTTISTPIRSFQTRQRTWQEVASLVGPAIYIIGLLKSNKIIGVGTGFAINDSTLITNGHVVNGLKEYLTEWGDTTLKAIAVQNGRSLFSDGFYYLNAFQVHPLYDTSKTETYDFGAVTVNGKMTKVIQIESQENLLSLSAGIEVASIGFPGELNFMSSQNPVATFKDGTISAVRAFGGTVATPTNSYYIQYNLSLSGGTSGSPVFNRSGKVVAVNNSGIEVLVYSEATGTWERIPQSSLNFGIRADLISATLTTSKTLFSSLKPAIVTYEFINGTWAELQLTFKNLGICDTIAYLDTLSFWDYVKTPKTEPIALKSIVATNNYLTWADTMRTGLNFSRRYIVTEDYFLLGLRNNSNKIMNSVVVSNTFEYDSSYLYLPIGNYKDVGFYRASQYTDIRTYFNNTTYLIKWDDVNTTSSTTEGTYIPLTASLALPKQQISQISEQKKGKKEFYYLQDYLKNKK